MACSCNKNKRQYEVVAANGKIVYRTGLEHLARSVSEKRYPGSSVREKEPAPKATARKTPARRTNR